jgi:stearoyl-CoA desaturase (delta-9 desaturase)
MALSSVRAWLDSSTAVTGQGLDYARVVPYVALHAGCLGVFWVGVSPRAVAVAAALYAIRMFAITAFYHRYFSHGAFKTSRAAQFVFAVLGASAAQRGALWWASQHRHHHAHADTAADPHSPARHGFFWSHVGWFLARENFAARTELVPRLARYPELRFLDRYDAVVPVLLGIALFAAGGLQLVVWGLCISTVALHHATFTINSLAHRFGSRRYATRDDSRNNFWLALLTYGEGWHNNHHHCPGAARQGERWWEIDPTWYGLKLLEATGVVWDLRERR